eukprot:7388004-Prymnesium_polylepis.4
MEESEDPLEWELRQMQHLQKLADMYAWGTGEAKYLQRVKLIQQEGEARMKASKASHGVANSRVPPTAASTGAAMKFLGAAPYGAWESDRDSPSGKGWRRYIAVDPEDETNYIRARIQTAKGRESYYYTQWEVIPKPNENDEEEGEEDEEEGEDEGEEG